MAWCQCWKSWWGKKSTWVSILYRSIKIQSPASFRHTSDSRQYEGCYPPFWRCAGQSFQSTIVIINLITASVLPFGCWNYKQHWPSELNFKRWPYKSLIKKIITLTLVICQILGVFSGSVIGLLGISGHIPNART